MRAREEGERAAADAACQIGRGCVVGVCLVWEGAQIACLKARQGGYSEGFRYVLTIVAVRPGTFCCGAVSSTTLPTVLVYKYVTGSRSTHQVSHTPSARPESDLSGGARHTDGNLEVTGCKAELIPALQHR